MIENNSRPKGALWDFRPVTEEVKKAKWRGIGLKAFRCAFCGEHLAEKSEFAAVYTNDTKAPLNPMCCRDCHDKYDGFMGLREEWLKRWNEYFIDNEKRNWFFNLRCGYQHES